MTFCFSRFSEAYIRHDPGQISLGKEANLSFVWLNWFCLLRGIFKAEFCLHFIVTEFLSYSLQLSLTFSFASSLISLKGTKRNMFTAVILSGRFSLLLICFPALWSQTRRRHDAISWKIHKLREKLRAKPSFPRRRLLVSSFSWTWHGQGVSSIPASGWEIHLVFLGDRFSQMDLEENLISCFSTKL